MNWQAELKQATTNSSLLLSQCQLSDSGLKIIQNPEFKAFIPPRWIKKIEKKNPYDPLLLQVLASTNELNTTSGFCDDPLEEQNKNILPGLIHKYTSRVLIITSGACPIHCRYCFRRNFPYETNILTDSRWVDIIQYIAEDSNIHEAILSGGDPLMLSNERLKKLLSSLYNIKHLKRIRFHTRFPTTIPSRFDHDFWKMIEPFASKIIWVWHINHANELDDDVGEICQIAHSYNMRVLSQSVLLRDINDKVETLEQLVWALDQHGIQPYYMHKLDHVNGASHYDVSTEDGITLMSKLRERVPGYLVPTYVADIPNCKSKTVL